MKELLCPECGYIVSHDILYGGTDGAIQCPSCDQTYIFTTIKRTKTYKVELRK